MKKILLGITAVVGVGVLGIVAAAAMQPDHLHVERKIVIDATAADMAPYAEDLKQLNAWSPWEEGDPNLKKTYSENTAGVGATYEWEGNDEVGKGKMVTKSVEPGKVVHALEFIEPFAGTAESAVAYAEQDGKLTVTWSFDEDPPFMSKVMGVFMDMDEMIGGQYEKGLAMLKPMVEEAASERVLAEKQKAAEAEAAALAAKAAEEAAEPTEVAEATPPTP